MSTNIERGRRRSADVFAFNIYGRANKPIIVLSHPGYHHRQIEVVRGYLPPPENAWFASIHPSTASQWSINVCLDIGCVAQTLATGTWERICSPISGPLDGWFPLDSVCADLDRSGMITRSSPLEYTWNHNWLACTPDWMTHEQRRLIEWECEWIGSAMAYVAKIVRGIRRRRPCSCRQLERHETAD